MNISSYFNYSPKFCRSKNNKTQPVPPYIKQPPKTAQYIVQGMLVTVPIMGGYQVYDNIQKQDMMKDFKEEYNQDDTKSLEIHDINDDNSPEYIIEKTDGVKCVYDFRHHDVYFDIDGDRIEKIR